MSEHRLTIRLDDVLYAQLAACGSRWQPLAAIVRQALTEYVARQPETPPPVPDVALMLADMAARLDALQEQVAALTARGDALAATRQPAADTAASAPALAPGSTRGPARGQAKLTPRQAKALRTKRARGTPIKVLMEEYGISKATLFRYLREP
jgi:hypothetical protein